MDYYGAVSVVWIGDAEITIDKGDIVTHSNQIKKPRIIIGLGKTGLSCVRYLHHDKCPLIMMDTRNNPPGLAEFQIQYPDIPVYTNAFSNADACALLLHAKDIIVSPGISIKEPALVACAQQGIPLIGDIELFARACTVPIVAITGSNAKGTVTTWLGEMAQASGIQVAVGGNIGTPALDLLPNHLLSDKNEPELYVLELSSFQLETTYSLQAKAAVILNISPDHLDRYDNLEAYAEAKQRIYHQCSVAVSNRDDVRTIPKTPPLESHFTFGLTAPSHATEWGIVTASSGEIWLAQGEELVFQVKELRVQGQHNWANALSALALAKALDLPMTAVKDALRSFKGLPHRCEWVAEQNAVKWYNDSKGTNVGATQAAIEGLGPTTQGKLILIAGGQGKGADFSLLRTSISRYVKAVILMGEDAPLLKSALHDCVSLLFVSSLPEAVEKAKQIAVPGDAVLLSPACASFDMFNNFEHRGEKFVEAVKEIVSASG